MDRKDLASLVGVHQAELYRYLRYLGAERSVAEDLLQESFLAAYAGPSALEPGTSACAAWLRGIARNKFLMHCRKERTERVHVQSAGVERAEEVWSGEYLRDGDGFDYLEALRGCFSKLGDRHQTILKEFYEGRKSREQLAADFELTDDGVKSMLRRLRESLASCVRKSLGLEPA
jgi:RNA polymerase sigma-70 factor (ECF subfamily)